MTERILPDVRLRPVVDADRAFLLAVYGSTRTDELAVVPWSTEERDAFLAMQFDAQDRHYREHHPGATFDVVLVDDQPAGRLYVDRRPDEVRVIDITLLHGYRGRGIGMLLLEGLMTEAAATGRRLTVHVVPSNPARTLYARLGFEQVGESGVHLLLAWRPADPEVASGEHGLVSHAVGVGAEGHQEQRELAQAGVVDGDRLLLDEMVVTSMEEQGEWDALGTDGPTARGLLAPREHELHCRAVTVDGAERLSDQRRESGAGEGLEHAQDATSTVADAAPIAIRDDSSHPSLSRRRVLTALGLGVLWTAAPAAGGVLASGARAIAAPNKNGRTTFDLATATAETFQPHVGTGFRLPGMGRPTPELVLEQVVQHGSADDVTDTFSLVFRPTRAVALAQLTYELDHASLGRLAMFLVPGSQTVSSVVNHLRV